MSIADVKRNGGYEYHYPRYIQKEYVDYVLLKDIVEFLVNKEPVLPDEVKVTTNQYLKYIRRIQDDILDTLYP